jgi:hypothetical protein
LSSPKKRILDLQVSSGPAALRLKAANNPQKAIAAQAPSGAPPKVRSSYGLWSSFCPRRICRPAISGADGVNQPAGLAGFFAECARMGKRAVEHCAINDIWYLLAAWNEQRRRAGTLKI